MLASLSRPAVLVLLAALLVPVAPAPPAAAAALSDTAFFGKWSSGGWATGPRLNYAHHDDLKPVEAAVKAGDYTLAKQRLLDYERERDPIQAGAFSHTTWPGALDLTADHIWTLGDGETYLGTLTFGPGETTVTADVTGSVSSGKPGFFLMSRHKDAEIARINSRSASSGKPALRLTLADGSVKTLRPAHDTYIWAANPDRVYGDKYLMQVSDQGKGPFTGETRKAYLGFDLSGVTGVRKAELTLTGTADTAKQIMLFGNAETFDEATRTWNNTVQNTYSWQGDPGGFDWKRPAGADKEYFYQLPRFFFAGPLALEYAKTRDERYARTLIGLMTDFIKDADALDADQGAGSYPGNLHAARRLTNWIAAYEILRTSPSLTPDANAAMLKTMNRAGLYLQTNVNETPNKMQTQKLALLHASVAFPEFRAKTAWQDDAVAFLTAQLDDSVHPDGGYKEATDGYLRGYITQYVDAIALMRRNGLDFPAAASAKLHKLGRFLMDQTYPNGYGTAYGDSDLLDMRSALRKLGELVDDPELRYVGTSGASGDEPAHTAALYPDTRVATSRSGWSAGDTHLRINADRGNHSHPDELAITAYAYGRPLLPDMGTYTYSTDARSEWLRRTTEAQNTIEIDDRPQTSTAPGGITNLVTNGAFDLIGGYTDGSAGARHERSVLSLHSGLWVVSDRLKPVDDAKHRYEQNWHFASDAGPSLRSGTKATATAFPEGANLTVVPADPGQVTAQLRDGYHAPQFYSVRDARYTSYVKTVAGQTTFDTLLVPSKGAADTSTTVTRLPVGGTPAYQATALSLNGGAGVYYKSWTTKASRTFGTHTFDGKLLYADAGAIVMVDGSAYERDGATVVKAPGPVKDLAVRFGADGTVRIDGSGLEASTDPAKAIAIAAPDASRVLLNGAAVPFERSGDLLYAATSLE